MNNKLRNLATAVVCVGGLVIASISTSQAMSISRGGPCGGASAPSHAITAHVVGREAQRTLKVIAHFDSDQNGKVIGELIVGQGVKRIEVTNWCRIWVGGKNAEDSGVIHVLGTSFDTIGRETYVQVDVRSSEGGRMRVRTRAMSQHDDEHQVAPSAEEEHGGWKSLTGEGWLTTTRLRVRTMGSPIP